MATCRNCLHFEVCDSGRHIGEYIRDDGVYSEGVEKDCECFVRRTAAPLGAIVYGKTPLYFARDGEVIEYTCAGYGEHMVWNDTEGAYTLARFVYGRNNKIASSVFMLAEHPTFSRTPTINREVFFDKKKAVEAAELQKK